MAKRLKFLTVVGARPQFIKAAPVSKAIREAGHREFLVHTGQHYDKNMSAIFFKELNIRRPDINLKVGSGGHGEQTGKILIGLEKVLNKVKPDCVLIYGDTNSTLAGALAAAKLHIPAAHIEAGLRSFNRQMPEEHNRVVADHVSDFLFCPTQTAVNNLKKESLSRNVYLVGDVMADALNFFSSKLSNENKILNRTGLSRGDYALVTIHRPVNADNPVYLKGIIRALELLPYPVVFPVHPRTSALLSKAGKINSKIKLISPVSYLNMLTLEKNARLILTDSGGVQKEAAILRVPCVTLREETEWVETVRAGWNVLAGHEINSILKFASAVLTKKKNANPYPFQNASKKIILILEKRLCEK